MASRRSRTSTPARLAAPAAILAALAAVVLVVRPSGGEDETTTPPAAETTPRTTTERGTAPARTSTTPAGPSDGPATYTVQPGDTLSAIAAETGVPVPELVELNPDANPSALTVGDELRLRDSAGE